MLVSTMVDTNLGETVDAASITIQEYLRHNRLNPAKIVSGFGNEMIDDHIVAMAQLTGLDNVRVVSKVMALQSDAKARLEEALC